ncbi:L-threonylcarbamoyladenylate synthase [Sphingomonas nostoxanthinifaciens]|uniref:L-threonylcarbamoyladenylate synthase n=1 Tax=Sphingomonas nostoxanthinifaciens TaxID=2872652 RepID=UPI001CC21041|nr:L-threonylcarbamoyladenylate synthase [Sphingomonas nostoxanthinifaciens]UAK23362.1 threonylcarbamoyl-AMP synthase [Sphingomonas nostoxanthinifaciens]
MSETSILPFDDAGIARAAALIRAGQPVAIPTETVYGLAADATDAAAVAAIYAAKGRPSFNPLIVHVPDLSAAQALADLPAPALRLAERFWPGPLTIVAPLRDGTPIARLTTAGLATIALRVPAHPAMQALLRVTGLPLAAPSANASGTISPTRAAHVLRSLGGRIPLVVDGGACAVGLESAIVAVGANGLRLLRPGPIAPDALAEAAGLPIAGAGSDAIEAPGQLAHHYAPSKPLRLDATSAAPDEWLIGFGAIAGDASLSPAGDLIEAAARLFDLLHAADAAPAERIAVAPVPRSGLGLAINDRLARAAAPQ